MTSREYWRPQARTIWPTRERHDERVQPQDSDEEPVGQADERAHAEAGEDRERQPVVRLGADAHDQIASEEHHPGVERSIPACMITSIWPSAATARIVM